MPNPPAWRQRHGLAVSALLIAGLMSLMVVGSASARPVHREKVHKTHRILAGSKSVRINDVGEVITNQHP